MNPVKLTPMDNPGYDLTFERFAPRAQTGGGSRAKVQDTWLQEVDDRHWTQTTRGKVFIEFISRATIGSLFYSMMEHSDQLKNLKNYRPEDFREKLKTEGAFKAGNWMEYVAYAFDGIAYATVGLPNKLLGRSDEKVKDILTFRPTHHDDNDRFGRSIGGEAMVVTSSFAAMSAGSAIARNTINGIFNPTERKSWSKDGKFDPIHVVKRLGAKAFEIATYNAGEDFAVAIPYAFVMKHSRNVLNTVFPGFKYGADQNTNGGSLVINEQMAVTDHFNAAGALDLQARFTLYNVGTQLYRDVYSGVAGAIAQHQSGAPAHEGDIPRPATHNNPLLHAANGVANGARYAAISGIRSILQMTPAVPFFWSFRTPPGRDKGLIIDPERGPLVRVRSDASGNIMRNAEGHVVFDPVKANQLQKDGSFSFTDKAQGEYFNGGKLYYMADHISPSVPDHQLADHLKPAPMDKLTTPAGGFAAGKRTGEVMYGLSEPGGPLRSRKLLRVSDKLGDWMHATGDKIASANIPLPKGLKSKLGELGDTWFMTAMSYPGYFALGKTIPREMYVNDQMNLAAGRLIDGVRQLNGNEVREGANEIGRTIFRLPFRDSERQASLVASHAANPSDNSPRPANWTAIKHEQYLKRVAERPTFIDERLREVEGEVRIAKQEEALRRRPRNYQDIAARPASWQDAVMVKTTLPNGIA